MPLLLLPMRSHITCIKFEVKLIPLYNGIKMNDKTPTRKCRVCVRKNIKKETRFLCAQCGVPVHPEGCYTRYHTLKHY